MTPTNPFAGTVETESPGFAAIRQKYGPKMVTYFENLPRVAEMYARAVYPEKDSTPPAIREWEEEQIRRDVEKAKRLTERVRLRRDIALAQAESTVYWIPEQDWEVVPSINQIRRRWGWPEA